MLPQIWRASLRPLLADPESPHWKKPAVTQIWHNKKAWGYSIRTEKFRYTEWLEGKAGRELYNHLSDSQEIHNLADNPAYSKIVAELSSNLKKYIRLPSHKRN